MMNLDDECPEGGEHEPVTEYDVVDELINGHIQEVKIWMTFCDKCDERLPDPSPFEFDDTNDFKESL
jgi:hypothetical protein